MVTALARAFRWRRLLEQGSHESVGAIAAAEKLDRGYVGTGLRLTLLAPAIVGAIRDGQSGELGLKRLLHPFLVEWQARERALGV